MLGVYCFILDNGRLGFYKGLDGLLFNRMDRTVWFSKDKIKKLTDTGFWLVFLLDNWIWTKTFELGFPLVLLDGD